MRKTAIAIVVALAAISGAGTKTQTYSIRNGDNDWSIAKKYGITSRELRLMNVGTNWNKLQVGQKIKVPLGNAPKSAPVASKPAPSVRETFSYRVKSGDNDWVIARRFDTRVSLLKSINPNIDFDNLKVGAVLRIPGSSPDKVVAKKSSEVRSRYAVISKDSVIVRRGPGTDREKVTVVPKSTPVMVLDRQSEWYKLKFPRGTVGWVRGDMLKAVKFERVAAKPSSATKNSKPVSVPAKTVAKSTVAPAKPAVATPKPEPAKTIVASAPKPAPKKPVVASAPKSVKKPAAKIATNWGSNSGGNERAVSEALAMVGTRYVYGAASRRATDCSGMVMQAYRAAGVNLPRTSAMMSRVGQSVSRGDLRPGDLVFFRTRGSRISHVGIYKGDGKFIHASSGKGHVTVSDLSGSYYAKRYAGAKRVAGASRAKPAAPVKQAPQPAEPKVEAPKPGDVDPKLETSPKPEKPNTNGTDQIAP